MRRLVTTSLVLLLILSSFTLVSHPAAATWPPPVADAGPDQTVAEGDDVTLDGSGSFDVNDEDLKYAWDFDDSNGTDDVDARGEVVTTTYGDAGVYTVTLTVTAAGDSDTDTCRITVTPSQPDNVAPVAYITSPIPGVYNLSEPITFEGGGLDADGDALRGTWDFGDGTKSNQPTTTHTYNDEGVQYVTWTVTDSKENDTARLVIYIGENPNPGQNRRPSAEISVARTDLYLNETILFSGYNSSDPDDDPLTYEWDFDLSDGLDTESTEMNITWSWNSTGSYTVTLQVRDGNTGGWDIASVEVTITEEPNEPPEANAGNDAEVQVGVSLSFRGTARDPDGDNITYYSWDFGDGDFWESNVSGKTNHTYTSPGEYTATFTVEDEEGARDSDTRRVTVNAPPDVPPTAHAGEDITTEQGKRVFFRGTGTDDFGIAKYEWDFNNDGVWDWESTRNGNADHVYEDYGTFTAILRVTDEPRPGNPGPGQTDEDSLLVTVKQNQPPTARISLSTLFWQTGQVVQFNHDSQDPEGATLEYAWDLDGDGKTDSSVERPTWVYHREGDYTVTLTVVDDFDQSSTDQITLQVTQSYSVEVDISSPIRDMDPGDSHEFRATVANDGNGIDQIRVSLSGANNDWATLDRSLLSLNATEKQTVTITVSVPSSALSTDEAIITVTASSNYGKASDAADIEVHVRHHPDLAATIDVSSISIRPGRSMEDVATITITNTGNGPDTFRVSFSGDVAGYLRTDSPRIDLAPGQTREVTISIDVAETIPPGTATGSVTVMSIASGKQQPLDFTVEIQGEGDGDGGFPVKLEGTFLYLIIGVVVIAIIVGFAVSMQRKRKPGNSRPTVRV